MTQEKVSTQAEAMNAFVRIGAEQRRLDKLISPLMKRMDDLESEVHKLKQSLKALKGKE